MFLEILLGLCALLFLLHLYVSRSFSFWKDKGIPFMKPIPFVGNFKDRVFLRTSVFDFDKYIYDYFQGHRFGGYYEGKVPGLIVRDPELVRQMTIKDFDHFVDRRTFIVNEEDMMNKMVSQLTGEEWKEVRSVITPAFSSGKMKRVFSSILDCSDNCLKYMSKYTASGDILDVKDCFGRYTMDVVAKAAFGVSCNCFDDPDAIFPKMGSRAMNVSPKRMVLFSIFFMFPQFFKFLKLNLFDQPAIDFFEQVVKETIAEREKNGVKGRDFLQLLLDARKGELQPDQEKDTAIDFGLESKRKAKHVLDDATVLAQSVLFFIAGYETTAATLSFICYELATHPEIQEKLHNEVKRVSEKSGGINYESIQEMEYMDKVFSEGQRLHPAATRLERVCTEDYKIPDTDITLEKNTLVIFPIAGFHMDPEHFPEPEKFDPERFNHENKSQRNQYVYMPFGVGPRNCIGMRFALMEAKALLAKVALNVKLVPCEKTQIPLKYSTTGTLLKAEKGIFLRVENRNK